MGDTDEAARLRRKLAAAADIYALRIEMLEGQLAGAVEDRDRYRKALSLAVGEDGIADWLERADLQRGQ
jgi:hypothetical protein